LIPLWKGTDSVTFESSLLALPQKNDKRTDLTTSDQLYSVSSDQHYSLPFKISW
jgi:hypothetical protein